MIVLFQVRSLAMCIDSSGSPDSDDEEAAHGNDGVSGVVDMFLAAVEMHPHRVACEEAMESKTYLQIYRHLGCFVLQICPGLFFWVEEFEGYDRLTNKIC